MMFTQQWPGRKRDREDDDENYNTGFSEHRTKRHIAALPHRTSPKLARTLTPTFSWDSNYTAQNYTAQPAPPTITPADSDEDNAAPEPRSFFSPYSSPSGATLMQGSPSSICGSPDTRSSQSTQMSNTFSEDFDMTDTVHLSPGSFHNDPSASIASRIPTPIHSSFAPFIRPEKASRHDADSADDETLVDRFRRGRRLPSPISEGENSPTMIVTSFEEMQMDVDHSSQPEPETQTPTKKGHTRSKHSLRAWTGLGGETGAPSGGMKRSFSMGYRADCDKCRMKVPGHFSHIITY